MNLFLKTSTLLKTGLAVAAVAVAAVNFSNANANTNAERVLTVSNANALTCPSAANKTCTGYTDDGLYHEATNAENQ